MVKGLWRDIEAALGHDPAAQGRLEILLAYPGVHALFVHRIAHKLWTGGFRLTARLVSQANRFGTGVEIHPGAQIADGVFIDHGMGVVIGETAVVEEGCIIYKGVVLGGTSLEKKVRHPHLHRNVIVGSNACVLGALDIGEGARIGSSSVVIKDVPPGATVVGVPGRIVEKRVPISDQLDHSALPDPVLELMRAMAQQQELLAERLANLEGRLPWLRSVPREEEPSEAELETDPRHRAGRIF
jgi:serine O-acetyltransferase